MLPCLSSALTSSLPSVNEDTWEQGFMAVCTVGPATPWCQCFMALNKLASLVVVTSWHRHKTEAEQLGRGPHGICCLSSSCGDGRSQRFCLPFNPSGAPCCLCLSGSGRSLVRWDPLSPRPYLRLTGQGISICSLRHANYPPSLARSKRLLLPAPVPSWHQNPARSNTALFNF